MGRMWPPDRQLPIPALGFLWGLKCISCFKLKRKAKFVWRIIYISFSVTTFWFLCMLLNLCTNVPIFSSNNVVGVQFLILTISSSIKSDKSIGFYGGNCVHWTPCFVMFFFCSCWVFFVVYLLILQISLFFVGLWLHLSKKKQVCHTSEATHYILRIVTFCGFYKSLFLSQLSGSRHSWETSKVSLSLDIQLQVLAVSL